MIFGMPTSLFPVLALDVFHAGPTGPRPARGGAGGRRAARRAAVRLGVQRPPGRAGRDRGGRDLGHRDHALRPGRARSSWRPVLPRDRRRGRRPVGGLPLDDRPARGARRAPRADQRRSTSSSSRAARGSATSRRRRSPSVIGAQAAVVSGGVLCILGVAGVVRQFPELARHVHDPDAPHRATSCAGCSRLPRRSARSKVARPTLLGRRGTGRSRATTCAASTAASTSACVREPGQSPDLRARPRTGRPQSRSPGHRSELSDRRIERADGQPLGGTQPASVRAATRNSSSGMDRASARDRAQPQPREDEHVVRLADLDRRRPSTIDRRERANPWRRAPGRPTSGGCPPAAPRRTPWGSTGA